MALRRRDGDARRVDEESMRIGNKLSIGELSIDEARPRDILVGSTTLTDGSEVVAPLRPALFFQGAEIRSIAKNGNLKAHFVLTSFRLLQSHPIALIHLFSNLQ